MTEVTPHARARQQLQEIASEIFNSADFAETARRLLAGEATTYDEVWGSGCALLVAALAKLGRPLLVVTSNLKSQDDLYDDLETFTRAKVQKFPACSIGVGQSLLVDQEYGDRLRLLKELTCAEQPSILVDACLHRVAFSHRSRG
jgi:transcription-repair coupling factor (superfamily II helicase)